MKFLKNTLSTINNLLHTTYCILPAVFLLLALSSCSAPSGLGFGSETMGGPSGSDATAPASGSTGGGDDVLGGSGGSDPAAAPQSSIPLPNVRSEYIVAYATDDSGVVPVKGFAGAADYDASYQMLVSTEDPATYTTARSSIQRSSASGLWLVASKIFSPLTLVTNTSHFFSTRDAVADDLDFGLCSETSATCCPILPDGSFECYVQTSGVSVGSVFYTIVDGEGNFVEGYDAVSGVTLVATAEVEDVNENALFLAQAPKGLAFAGESITDTAGDMMNHFGALGEDMVVQVKDTGGTFAVMGLYTDSYHDTDALSAAQIAFDESSNLTLLEEIAGIDLFTSATSSTSSEYMFTDSGRDTTVANTEAYTMLKLANNTLMFGRDKEDATISRSGDSIFNALDGTETEFIHLDLTDSVSGASIQSDRVISFDVDENGCALVVFSDNEGNLRMRAVYTDEYGREYRWGGETALAGTDVDGNTYTLTVEDFKDLVIYSSSLTTSELSGIALLLDKTRNAVWTINYRYDGSPATSTVTPDLDFNVNATLVGNGPIAIVLNEDKTIAFVLNETDKTVSTLRLGATSVTSVATISLSDSLSGKSIELSPNSLTFYTNEDTGCEYVLVGDANIEGFLVVDVTPEAPVVPAAMSLPRPSMPRPAAAATVISF